MQLSARNWLGRNVESVTQRGYFLSRCAGILFFSFFFSLIFFVCCLQNLPKSRERAVVMDNGMEKFFGVDREYGVCDVGKARSESAQSVEIYLRQ